MFAFLSLPDGNYSGDFRCPGSKQNAMNQEKIYKLRGSTSRTVIVMNVLEKRLILRRIGQNAAARAAALSREYIDARSEDKGAIIDGIDIERWLSEAVQECLR